MATIIGAPTLDDALFVLAARVSACEERGEKCLVFCEDSLTLLAERAVLERTGGTFLTEVTTFARFLSGERRVLSKQGSVMAISAILAGCEGELSCFSAGAAQTVYETLAQFAASRVDAAQLRAGAQATEGTLRAKLTDLALLSEKYAAFLAEHGLLDESGYLALLPEAIAEKLEGVNVFFAAFPSFTRQAAEGIRAAAEHARSVTGIFFAGKAPLYTNEAARIFRDVCEQAGDVQTVMAACSLPVEAERVRCGLFAPEIFTQPPVPAEHVHLFSAHDEAEEADAVCALIGRHVALGARYRDIVVLAPDESSRLVLEKAFAAYHIPYFADRKRPFSHHPFVRFVIAVLRAVADGGRPESVDAVAANVCFGDGDVYRNYLLKYGNWRGGYRRAIREDAPAFADDLKNISACRERMVRIMDALPRRGRAHDFADAIVGLRALVGADKIMEQLSQHAEAADQAFLRLDRLDGMLAEMNVAGEKVFTAREFASLLESGASALKTAMIPSLADTVYLGDATDSRFARAKVLFLTGLTDALPRTGEDTSVITDAEMGRLAALSVHVEPAISVVNARARESFGLNACTFSGELYASRPMKVRGEEKAAGEAYSYLARMFEPAPLPARFPYDCAARVPALLRLLSAKADFEEGRENDTSLFSSIWAALAARIGEDALRALTEDGQKGDVPEAAQLYFAGETSPTLLESYFACPYAGFMKYVLRLSEREEGALPARDAGDFVHKVLEQMGDALSTLSSEADCRALARNTARSLMSEPRYRAFGDTEQSKYAGERLIAECERVACAVFASLHNSAFRIRDREASIRIPALNMTGKADRVDEAGDYVRIVDYKTGHFDPSPAAYYTGRSLQLELYLLAAAEGSKPAGAFYFPAEDAFTAPEDAKFCMQGFYNRDAVNLLDSAAGAKSALFDGAPSRGLAEEEFEDFLAYGALVARQAQREMGAGNVRPSPYEGSCNYCAFRGACGFVGEARKEKSVKAAEIAAVARAEKEGV